MRKLLLGIGVIVGIYLVGRAIAEPFVINASDPSTYHNDWGGPSLAGVVAVHCGPGLLVAAAAVWSAIRTLGRRRRATASTTDRPLRQLMM
jgi:hypothetical protein